MRRARSRQLPSWKMNCNFSASNAAQWKTKESKAENKVIGEMGEGHFWGKWRAGFIPSYPCELHQRTWLARSLNTFLVSALHTKCIKKMFFPKMLQKQHVLLLNHK
jgi:hypothetical protein